MLICDQISCIRGKNPVFERLGFCLAEGSLLLLKGPNGAGKTSLLDILAGKLLPASGGILWDGKPIHNNEAFRHDMITIGHENFITPVMSVEEHLAACAEYYGTELLIPAALAFFDLTEFKDRPAEELSAGWRRRVSLARLIVAPCKLWLLDEPTDFLDEESVLLTVSLIETRVRQGGIVIAASHSLRSGLGAHALDMADFRP